MSNYYNHARAEYNRQIALATATNDLAEFLSYGVRGFLDGLINILEVIQENQLVITWENYIYDYFADKNVKGKAVQANKNKRTILLHMPHKHYVTLEELKKSHPDIAIIANDLNPRSFSRYMDELTEPDFIEKIKDGFRAKTEIPGKFMAVSVR